MKKAVITGITGQDGSYLADFLLKKNYIVHGIVRRTSSINRERIKLIFKIAGASDPAANLPCTFMIDVKCATKEIKII